MAFPRKNFAHSSSYVIELRWDEVWKFFMFWSFEMGNPIDVQILWGSTPLKSAFFCTIWTKTFVEKISFSRVLRTGIFVWSNSYMLGESVEKLFGVSKLFQMGRSTLFPAVFREKGSKIAKIGYFRRFCPILAIFDPLFSENCRKWGAPAHLKEFWYPQKCFHTFSKHIRVTSYKKSGP